ncbi:MAG: GTP-binding protein, partial [Pseudomonadota bacterium]
MRCFSVIGPSQTGKSTLLDQFARIDGPAHETQSQSGIRVVRFDAFGESWHGIDCPGAIEDISHTQMALLASDVAIVVVSPDPDKAVLAAPYLRAAEEAGTPCMILINRLDEPKGRIRDVVSSLQEFANHPL